MTLDPAGPGAAETPGDCLAVGGAGLGSARLSAAARLVYAAHPPGRGGLGAVLAAVEMACACGGHRRRLAAPPRLADLLTLPRRKWLSVECHAGRIASLRKNHRVSLLLLNHSRRRLAVEVRDDVPQQLDPPARPNSLCPCCPTAVRQ